VPKFDPYATLGVVPDAPDFVIQAAYRACLKKYHPDQYSEADARQKTDDILKAYRLVGTSAARTKYDGIRSNANTRTSEDTPNPAEFWQEENQMPVKAGLSSDSNLVGGKVLTWTFGIGLIIALFVIWYIKKENASEKPAMNESAAIPKIIEAKAIEIKQEEPLPPPLPVLDDTIVFTNPADCTMSRATEELFEGLITFQKPDYVGMRGPAVRLRGFTDPLIPTFSRTVDTSENRNVRDNEATLATVGLWNGLRVSKIRVRYMEESSFWEHQIRFLEPPAKVRSTLNNKGFKLPAVGEFREYTEGGVVSEAIGVEALPGGSALTCGSSLFY